jgi:phage tail tape-measure protein
MRAGIQELRLPTPVAGQSLDCQFKRQPPHQERNSKPAVRVGYTRGGEAGKSIMSNASKSITTAVVLVMLIAAAGCSGQPLSTREKGTGIGALAGGATGAIIGAAVGAPGVGAAIGGALGAGGGFLLGNALQNQETQTQQTQSQIQSQQQEIERQRREIQQLQQETE